MPLALELKCHNTSLFWLVAGLGISHFPDLTALPVVLPRQSPLISFAPLDRVSNFQPER